MGVTLLSFFLNKHLLSDSYISSFIHKRKHYREQRIIWFSTPTRSFPAKISYTRLYTHWYFLCYCVIYILFVWHETKAHQFSFNLLSWFKPFKLYKSCMHIIYYFLNRFDRKWAYLLYIFLKQHIYFCMNTQIRWRSFYECIYEQTKCIAITITNSYSFNNINY